MDQYDNNQPNTINFKQKRKQLQRSNKTSSSLKEKFVLGVKVILTLVMMAAILRICTHGSL